MNTRKSHRTAPARRDVARAVRQAAFETLEGRQLMSATLLAGGFLKVVGTAGHDVIDVSRDASYIYVKENGVQSKFAAAGVTTMTAFGQEGNDVVTVAANVTIPTTLHGGAGTDKLTAGGGKDSLYGEEGDDLLDGGLGGDRFSGGPGTDTVTYAFRAGPVTVNLPDPSDTGTADDGALNEGDVILGDNEQFYGGAGNDKFVGTNAAERFWGNGGNDSVSAGGGDDVIYGVTGDDSLEGGAGNDTIVAGPGNDMLFGKAGDDYLDAGDGDDFVDPDLGSDTVFGRGGTDTVAYFTRTKNLRISLDDVRNDGEAGEADNVRSDVENVMSGSGNDVLVGSAADNKLWAGAGNDDVRGLAGTDTLDGGAGNDALFAGTGAGSDQLIGGLGNDVLVAIGGGSDSAKGGDGTDTFWVDSTDVTDATAAEKSSGWFHAVKSFANGASLDLAGQNLTDPGLSGYAASYGASFSNVPLFGPTGPQMTDVDQAGLGDCWFLAGLAGVARAKPDLIRQSVVDLGDGTYAAQFWSDGKPVFYRVDGQLPLAANGNPIFAQTANNTLWAPILEKAYAFHRSSADQYKDMNSGWGDEAFQALNKYTEADDTVWHTEATMAQRMRDRLLAGGAVTACTDPPALGCSIVASHCYTVIGVSADLKTITMRNPWGSDGKGGDGVDDGIIKISMEQFDDDVWQIGYAWL